MARSPHRKVVGSTAAQRRAEKPRDYRKYDLKRSFGIDLGEYQRMFVKQEGVCAICKRPELAKRNGKAKWLAVDHNHSTGEIRGLLCGNCNPMLGFAKEDSARLLAAVKYLDSFAADNIVPLKAVT